VTASSKAALEHRFGTGPAADYRKELVQVAAVAVAMIECFDRHNDLDKEPFVRCEYQDAEEHRERVLTGSLGLEGAWSKWIPGKPEKCLMNRQYEYRKSNRKV
jgi:hypothetical protein